MDVVTIEPWHLTLVLVLAGTLGSAGLAAKLFAIADQPRNGPMGSGSPAGYITFGIIVLIAMFIPCVLAWWFLFQRLISNVLQTM